MIYLACKFRDTDSRTYSYHYDGDEDFEPGDKVRVPDRSGDGWKVVTVAAIHFDEPEFPTKGILGRHVEEQDQEDLFGDGQ